MEQVRSVSATEIARLPRMIAERRAWIGKLEENGYTRFGKVPTAGHKDRYSYNLTLEDARLAQLVDALECAEEEAPYDAPGSILVEISGIPGWHVIFDPTGGTDRSQWLPDAVVRHLDMLEGRDTETDDIAAEALLNQLSLLATVKPVGTTTTR